MSARLGRPEKSWLALIASDPQSKESMIGPVEKVMTPFQAEFVTAKDSVGRVLSQRSSSVAWGEHVLAEVANRQPRAMFVDAQAMKEKVRQTLAGKQTYDVAEFYYTSGLPQRIARSPLFEYATLTVISLNAIWIAIDTDHNTADALFDSGAGFILAENLFCAYFFTEWFIRFLAFKRKLNGLKDAWFAFDSLLVFMMVMETWVMSFVVKFTSSDAGAGMGNASILRMARLLRLSRMARMVRLLRAVPELMILVKGMASATRSVVFTLILLLFFVYIFAIFFTQLAEEHEALSPYFHSVGQSMYTLAMHGVFLEDLLVVMDTLTEEYMFLALVFFFFVMLAAMTMMNMLIGVLCEVVSAVSSTEKEALEVAFVKSKLQQVLITIFPEKANQDFLDLSITKAEYEMILENASAARLLQEVGVDVVGLVDLTDLFFEEQDQESQDQESENDAQMKTLSFGDLMESVLELRGTNSATVKDVMNLRKFVRNAIDARLEKIEKTLVGLLSRKHGDHMAMRHRKSNDPSEVDDLPGLKDLGSSLKDPIALKDSEGSTRTSLSAYSISQPVPSRSSLPGTQRDASNYPRLAEANHAPRDPLQAIQSLGTRMDSMEASMNSRMESLEASMRQIIERLPPGRCW
mmetsp:Transcript_92028/g.269247  ORF Transcript_92028/g.269247 Transcript_92028/m.269247 type:complete len:635 (-) Transcript_92028:165-2069(-)